MEDRAVYQVGGRKKPVTSQDLRSWMDRLRPDQLNAPAMICVGVEVLAVSALVGEVGDYVGVWSQTRLTRRIGT